MSLFKVGTANNKINIQIPIIGIGMNRLRINMPIVHMVKVQARSRYGVPATQSI